MEYKIGSPESIHELESIVEQLEESLDYLEFIFNFVDESQLSLTPG